jgi:hypothetical protein
MSNEMIFLTEKEQLNNRLENIGWGSFLIMLGGIWLVPDQFIPEGTWLIGAGLILIGLNLVRYLNQIEMSSFTLILGGAALLIGISDFFRVDLPFFPILLIIIGAKLIIQPLIENRSVEK